LAGLVAQKLESLPHADRLAIELYLETEMGPTELGNDTERQGFGGQVHFTFWVSDENPAKPSISVLSGYFVGNHPRV
jgi:hypothetical protein